MNAITKEEQTALTLPERAAVALGAADYEVKIKAKVAASTDITAVIDPAGREQAHRIGMDLLKLRTGITAAAEEARKDATAFSKAVIAKEKELVGLITPEETRVMTLRDGWDEKIAAEKAAKIAAERLRVECIADAIAALREDETDAIRICKTAEAVGETLAYCLARPVTVEIFQERHAEALEIRAAVAESIRAVLAERQTSEAAALAAEEARKAEAARIEAERAELAKLRADAERVANEQAKERQRLANLAAAQERAAAELRAKAAANLEAEKYALAEQVRIQREAAAEAQRKLDAQQAEIDAKRAAFAREQEEAAARVEAAAKLEADHPQGLIDNAQFDIDREAERARKQALADQHLADKRDLPRPESATVLDAMIDAGLDDFELSDEQIEEFGAEWGLDKPALVVRLRKYVADADAAA